MGSDHRACHVCRFTATLGLPSRSLPKTVWAVLVRAVRCTGYLPAQQTRESKTNRSSAEVGLRVGSFSEHKEWVKLRCWYWTYRKKTIVIAKLAVVAKRKRNMHIAPFDLFYALALGTGNQWGEHQAFMEADIPEKCCCQAILHWLYNFSNMGGFDCASHRL